MNKRTTPRVRPHTHAAGFTLIELMITVVILASLAAIAYPEYRERVDRARLTAMVSEISAGKVGMETLLLDGPLNRVIPPAEVGLKPSTELCTRVKAVAWPDDPMATLNCVSQFGEVQLWYTTTDGWACYAYIRVRDWVPENCKLAGILRPDP
ncbi:prepilin-type N-terminal cleavage/methylation domain-containing protein [Stenotrophomonas sp. TWI1183]|uniref:pilin n=1 Tax=Stenotrophomonas sp. TWI1183 TaxID=3136799 RepID=UPI00320B378B